MPAPRSIAATSLEHDAAERQGLSRFWLLLWKAAQNWIEKDGPLWSAALAYYGAVSLFPICLVLIAALGVISQNSSTLDERQQELLAAVENNVSPWVAEQLQALLSSIKLQAAVGGRVGVVMLLVAAVGAFCQLEAAFRRVFGGGPNPQKGLVAALRLVLHDRLLAFLLLLGAGGALIVVFLLNMTVSALRFRFLDAAQSAALSQPLQLALNLVLNCLLFTTMFKLLPRVRIRWGAALGGGVLTAVTWQVGQRLLEGLVISNYYSPYGVVGAFLAIMLWMYYASAVLMLGACFVQTINSRN